MPDYLEFSPNNWCAFAKVAEKDGMDIREVYARVLAEVPWDKWKEGEAVPGVPREAGERMRSVEESVNPAWKTSNPMWPQIARWMYWENWARSVRVAFDLAETATPDSWPEEGNGFLRALLDEAAAWQGHFGEEAARLAAPRFFMMAAVDFLLRHGLNDGMRKSHLPWEKYAVSRRCHAVSIADYSIAISYEFGKGVGRCGQWFLDEARVADAEAKMHHARGEAEAEREARKRAETAAEKGRKIEEALEEIRQDSRATREALEWLREREEKKTRRRAKTAKRNARRGRDDWLTDTFWGKFFKGVDKAILAEKKLSPQKRRTIGGIIGDEMETCGAKMTITPDAVIRRWYRWKKGRKEK